MNTVGNGMDEINASFCAIVNATGFSCHRHQISNIEVTHSKMDNIIATVHHSLIENVGNLMKILNETFYEVTNLYHLSVQCCFRSVKYRMPWMELFEQNSLNTS